MTLNRTVAPELLDQLPADDPRAVRSRHDLKRLNAFMLQASIMARALTKYCGNDAPGTLLDLGAGDGTFMLRVARQLGPRWQGVTAILLDQQNIVSGDTRNGFAAVGWKVETIKADVFDLLERTNPRSVDAMTANLFLHHFPQEQLTRLLARAAQLAWMFVACEPRRTTFVRESSRMLWALGCNDVSRHDALASVRAGFTGEELSALWPDHDQWELHEHAARLFSHCFVARRTRSGDRSIA